MLCLSRNEGEKIYVKDRDGKLLLTLTVVEIRPDRVKLGLDAPPEIDIFRDDAKDMTPRVRARRGE